MSPGCVGDEGFASTGPSPRCCGNDLAVFNVTGAITHLPPMAHDMSHPMCRSRALTHANPTDSLVTECRGIRYGRFTTATSSQMDSRHAGDDLGQFLGESTCQSQVSCLIELGGAVVHNDEGSPCRERDEGKMADGRDRER